MKKLISVLLLIAALPLVASVSIKQTSATSIVAYAGRTVIGGYACTCGCAGCICDPGESPLECNRMTVPKDKGQTQDSSNDLSGMVAILLVILALGYRIK